MPIYEYACTSCGKNFENMQRITEAPLTECPFCKGKVKKLVSNCSFQLKGTGWYVTDYGNGKKPEGTSEKLKEKEERKKRRKRQGKKKKEARKEEKKEAKAEKGKDTSTAKENAVNQ